MRAVDEWIGANDDTPFPPRVRVRVFERAGGKCEVCSRKLGPADKWQVDHIIALINGGANRESNARCICDWCHKAKTRQDVAAKSKTARVRAHHLGIKPKTSRPIPGSKASGIKRRFDGTTINRATGEPV